MVTKKQVMDKLEEVYDPHIPVNIVDLGFIYGVEVKDDKVEIKMTLTNPMCPMSSMITSEVKEVVSKISGVKDVKIELVFDPPWSPEMISDKAKKKLEVE